MRIIYGRATRDHYTLRVQTVEAAAKADANSNVQGQPTTSWHEPRVLQVLPCSFIRSGYMTD